LEDIMAGLSVILAFAASGSGGVDPVSLSAKGFIECAQPDESSKTCEGMATYVRQPDGSIMSVDQFVISKQPQVVVHSRTKVTLRGQSMCHMNEDVALARASFVIAGAAATEEEARSWRQWQKERLGIMYENEVCSSYPAGLKLVVVLTSIGGMPAVSDPIAIRWVRPDEGFKLVSEQAGEPLE
jgi:hypothetical protein